MKTIRIDSTNVPDLPDSVCAIGYFDGLHLGHQQLIELARSQAEQKQLQSAVLTFDPDPWKVLKPGADLSHLSSLEDKKQLLEAFGVDLFYIVDFSKAFAALSVEAFHQFLKALHIRELVCGFDFTYGSFGKGNAKTLQECSYFETDVVSKISDESEKISSSRIESLIREGDVFKANELLGYLYSLKGTVVHGFKRGRDLGCPTANLDVSKEAVLPKNGVYAGFVEVGQDLLPAMINVGYNPTFNNQSVTVEANVLNADLDLYGKTTRFFFASRLRGEVRFDSLDELKEQLKLDAKNTLLVLPQSKPLFARTAKLWSLSSVNDILSK